MFHSLWCRYQELASTLRLRPRGRARSTYRLELQRLEDRTLPSISIPADPLILNPTDVEVAALTAPDVPDVFQMDLNMSGRLSVQVQAAAGSGLDTRLTLLGQDGQVLLQSDATSLTNPDDSFVQHLIASTYYLAVESLNGLTGSFTLTTQFQPANAPFDLIPTGTDPRAVVRGDFNHDGIQDLAVANSTSNDVSLLLGLGDGTFQPAVSYPVGVGPLALVAADFNGDGNLDLATANQGSDTVAASVTVLLGNGDGTFKDAMQFDGGGNALTVGDFDGDRKLDLAVVNTSTNSVQILQGQGDGTFQPLGAEQFVGGNPTAVVTGDFNGDGVLDLATANLGNDTEAPSVGILLGNGDGTFQNVVQVAVGSVPTPPLSGDFPFALVAADFNGDGRLDLATANGFFDFTTGNSTGEGDVSILLGNGDGTFQPQVRYRVGTKPLALLTGDFNGDGRVDLATANNDSQDVSILLGKGDGTFGRSTPYTLQSAPYAIASGDFNGDGHTDLATANNGPGGSAAVLLGHGDGSFASNVQSPVGFNPAALVSADFNGDGRPDLVAANQGSNDISVLLGEGDGTLQTELRYPVGQVPTGLATGDFNRDGRTDLAVANSGSGTVSILLGNGDGTFRNLNPQGFAVGANPIAVAAGDFNGDGMLDLATANGLDNTVTILRGHGDGTFQQVEKIAVGQDPVALVAGDFNGDGRLDLAVADSGLLADGSQGAGDVLILLQQADGTFVSAGSYYQGLFPHNLVMADFNGDGKPDLAAGSGQDVTGEVAVLLGLGDGTFATTAANGDPLRFDLNDNPTGLAVGDFNGDGFLDIGASTGGSGNLRALLGNGDGTFQSQIGYNSEGSSFAITAADFNGDGLTDLATANQSPSLVLVHPAAVYSGGVLDFPYQQTATSVPSTPMLADVNGDGVRDSIVIDRSGNILLRLGQANDPLAFSSPIVVNPGRPARAVATLRAGPQTLLAAIDQRGSLLNGQFQYTISLYSVDASGTPSRTQTFASGLDFPIRIVAADLAQNGDGYYDLAVLNGATPRLMVYIADGSGGFADPRQMDLDGNGPIDLTAADVNGDGTPELLVTNQLSGDVSVVTLDSGWPIARLLFRASGGLHGITETDSIAGLTSQKTQGVAVADFNHDGNLDLVAPSPGGDAYSVLLGRGSGSFTNPLTVPLDFSPAVVVTGQFNDDNNDGSINAQDFADLAFLDEQNRTIHIFLGDGAGHFTEKRNLLNGQVIPLLAGNAPTGLSVADVNGDGIPDLLVGNEFGDVLILLGNGDGTFQPYQQTRGNITLAVADLNGDGRADFVFGDQSLNRVAVQYSQPGQTFVQDQSNGILAPGAVRVADLNGDGLNDLIVANGGGNDVLVYLGTGGGQFGPAQAFFVGTNPVGLTIADVNGDGILDAVVANQGSNDVSVLLGQGQGADWTFASGPRLQAGGTAPVATTVQDVNGDGVPDILVTDQGSNAVALLPGVGSGFFNDVNPTIFATGTAPTQALLGDFTGTGNLDLVTVNSGSNDLTFFSNVTSAVIAASGLPTQTPVVLTGSSISSGGIRPVAALAGDFSGDGVKDLVVANNGNGAFILFLGEAGGLALSQTVFSSDVVNPTAIELEEVTENSLTIYAAEEGEEAVSSVQFSFEFGVPVPVPGNPGSDFEGQRPDFAEVSPGGADAPPGIINVVPGSSVSSVQAPVTRSFGPPEPGFPGASEGIGEGTVVLPGGAGAAQVTALLRFQAGGVNELIALLLLDVNGENVLVVAAVRGEEGDGAVMPAVHANDPAGPDGGEERPASAVPGREDPTLRDFLLGVDEALEQNRAAARQQLLAPNSAPPLPAPEPEGDSQNEVFEQRLVGHITVSSTGGGTAGAATAPVGEEWHTSLVQVLFAQQGSPFLDHNFHKTVEEVAHGLDEAGLLALRVQATAPRSQVVLADCSLAGTSGEETPAPVSHLEPARGSDTTSRLPAQVEASAPSTIVEAATRSPRQLVSPIAEAIWEPALLLPPGMELPLITGSFADARQVEPCHEERPCTPAAAALLVLGAQFPRWTDRDDGQRRERRKPADGRSFKS